VNVIGNVQVKFSINLRNLWAGEKIVVNLGDSVTAQDSAEVYCFIKYVNESISHQFASVDYSNLS